MHYIQLGRFGPRVSPICLGTMMFGGRTDEGEARAIIAMARDAGINFVDTADVYNDGRAEEIVGRAIRRRLGSEWIDIFYLHREDHTTPLEETISAVGDLISSGRSATSASLISVAGGLPRSSGSATGLESTGR